VYSEGITRFEFRCRLLKSPGLILDQYFRKYDQLGKKPGLSALLLWVARSLVNKPSRDRASLKRYFFANRSPEKSTLSHTDPPGIEVIFVSKIEDIEILGLAVNLVVQNSLNPITQIIIAVPEHQLNSSREYFFRTQYHNLIEVISENQLAPKSVIALIKEKSPERFGWILQQVLVAGHILKTESEFVLVVDSDTLIIRPQVWVDKFKRQILMPTFELHLPYYRFFRDLSAKYPKPEISFVSHHMLIQTSIFREVFQIFGGNIYTALEKAFAFADLKDNSPFDLKYEIYAQYLIENYENRVSYVKWANLSHSRHQLKRLMDREVIDEQYAPRYNSISLHHWYDKPKRT